MKLINITTFLPMHAPYDEAHFVIYGVPFDDTSSFRAGSRWAPDVMRKVSYNFETYVPEFDVNLDDVPIHDMGNCDTYVSVDETLEEVYNAYERDRQCRKNTDHDGRRTLADLPVCQIVRRKSRVCRHGRSLDLRPGIPGRQE